MTTLSGKTALVTGSTSGIGLGIALSLARAGANLILNGFGDASKVIAEVEQFGGKVGHHPADVSDPAQIADMIAYAEREFVEASSLDDGDPAHHEEALSGYRRALEIDPDLVPAIINLANIHYSRNEIAEAQALYERAIGLEPEVFEAHFNLGNIFHDLGRYSDARICYRDALQLNPTYADAHFYLAVTLEKNGQSQEARLHWKAYQELAPNGEWVHLAKEFSD